MRKGNERWRNKPSLSTACLIGISESIAGNQQTERIGEERNLTYSFHSSIVTSIQPSLVSDK